MSMAYTVARSLARRTICTPEPWRPEMRMTMETRGRPHLDVCRISYCMHSLSIPAPLVIEYEMCSTLLVGAWASGSGKSDEKPEAVE